MLRHSPVRHGIGGDMCPRYCCVCPLKLPAHAQGNLTRFINHSDAPNVQVGPLNRPAQPTLGGVKLPPVRAAPKVVCRQ